MIIAKINPPAKYINRDSLFKITKADCDYMAAIARPYPIGAKTVYFQLIFGIAESYFPEGSLQIFPNISSFLPMIESEILLDSVDLSE